MINAAFFEAARQSPPVVLGKQLQDFTLGHYLFLSEADSPFLPQSTERVPAPLDLYLAAHICSGPVARQRALLKSHFSALRFRLWAWRCSRLNPLEELKKFAGYISTSFRWPKPEALGGAPTRTPHVYGLRVFLKDRLHQQRSEVDDTPLYEAHADYAEWVACHIKSDGGLDTEGKHKVFGPWNAECEEAWQAVHAANAGGAT